MHGVHFLLLASGSPPPGGDCRSRSLSLSGRLACSLILRWLKRVEVVNGGSLAVPVLGWVIFILELDGHCPSLLLEHSAACGTLGGKISADFFLAAVHI